MEKNYSFGKCVSVSEHEFFLEEGIKDFMTNIIQMQTKNMICIGADSWNTNPINNHHIQKIFVNKKHPIIVASAGENAKKYENGNIITIKDIIENIIKTYDGTNIEMILKKLEISTKNFLKDMNIPDNKMSVFVQYFVCYMENKKIVMKRLECYKYREYDLLNNAVIIGPLFKILENSFINPDFNCFGKYSNEFNQKYLKYKVKDGPNMHKLMKSYVNQHIERDKRANKNKEKRTVGGDIYVATMNIEGNIKTYINGIEKEF